MPFKNVIKMVETIQISKTEEREVSLLQSDIMEMLKRNGPMNRGQMVAYLDRPRTTIYDNLAVLITAEKVKKFSRQVNSRGRPIVFFKLPD